MDRMVRDELDSIGKPPVALRSDGVTVLAISGMSAAVAHDPSFLFAFDVAVDARQPGADLIHQLTLAEGQDVIGPFIDGGRRGLDAPQSSLSREPDHAGDPLDAVFCGARVIAEPGVRT